MSNKSFENVWDAIEDSPEEAENMKVRSALMTSIRKRIKDLGLSQRETAELLGVSQPRVSELQNGRIDLFSVDKLITLAKKAGLSVRIDVALTEAA